MGKTWIAIVDNLHDGLCEDGQRGDSIVDFTRGYWNQRLKTKYVVARTLVRRVAQEVHRSWRICGEWHAEYENLATAKWRGTIGCTGLVNQAIDCGASRSGVLIGRAETNGAGRDQPRLVGDIEISGEHAGCLHPRVLHIDIQKELLTDARGRDRSASRIGDFEAKPHR